MELNDLLCAAAEKLGLKDTHLDTMRKRQSELRASIANSQTLLDVYIDKISQLDDELAELKNKYSASGGGVKEVYARKIKIAFNKRKRLLEPVDAISDRIELHELYCDKLELLIFAEYHADYLKLVKYPDGGERTAISIVDWNGLIDLLKRIRIDHANHKKNRQSFFNEADRENLSALLSNIAPIDNQAIREIVGAIRNCIQR